MHLLTYKKGSRSPLRKFSKVTRDLFVSLGLQEVITYTLLNEKDSKYFVDREDDEITLLNAMSEDRKYLRRSLLPSLLEVYRYNTKRQQKDIAIFEISNVYSKEETYKERTLLSCLISGTLTHNTWKKEKIEADFYALKGMVEAYFKHLGITEGRYQFQRENLCDMHPGRSAAIYVDRKKIGFLGQVHPTIEKSAVYVLELDLSFLEQLSIRDIKAKEITKFPTVTKDMAFAVSREVTCEEILNVMKKAGGRILKSISVFDVYEGENVGKDEKSIAFSLTFEDATKTLTDDEVMEVFNKIVENVTEKCHATLRDK